MEDIQGTTTSHSNQSLKPKQRSPDEQSPQWTAGKYILRWAIVVSAVVTTITSLVWIRAPFSRDSWILLSPLYGLPYPILSLIWEAAEILVIIRHKHNKAKGMHPGAHVACELILCGAGASIGSVWISVTSSYLQDSYFYNGNSGTTLSTLKIWASVTYFWGAVVLLMAVVQFTIFVLSCIDVDRKRRQLEYQVSHIMKVIEERGGNPEDLLRSLQEAPKTPSYPPVELPAINHNSPAELSVEERLTEVGDENRAGEMPANTPREARMKYRF